MNRRAYRQRTGCGVPERSMIGKYLHGIPRSAGLNVFTILAATTRMLDLSIAMRPELDSRVSQRTADIPAYRARSESSCGKRDFGNADYEDLINLNDAVTLFSVSFLEAT